MSETRGRRRLALCLGAVCLIAWGYAQALDPGRASGTLTIRGESVALTQAYAWRHDGKELDHPELRILLADREVPEDLLAGPLAMLPQRWAETGRLQGVLLRQGLRGTGQPWRVLPLIRQGARYADLDRLPHRLGPQDLRIADDIAMGADPAASFVLKAHFDAPLFHDEPVSQLLAGARARASAPVAALAAFNEAWRHAEWETMAGHATAEEHAAMDEVVQAYRRDMAGASPQEQAQIADGLLIVVDDAAKTRADVLRVVVRGRRAVILRRRLGPQNMRLEDGRWKVDY